MKRPLFLLTLGVASYIPAHAAVGDVLDLSQGYVADGVSATITNGVLASFDKYAVQDSTRFYDSSKGWASANGRYGDSNMCWAHTASNMIQYWQSYYGVFYKGTSALPYGTDYTRTFKSVYSAVNDITVADPMRLNVAKDIINVGFNTSASNTGKRVTEGTNYFFSWVDSDGGYYSEYFGPIHNGQVSADDHTGIITEVSSLNDLKSALFTTLGIEKTNEGYIQAESGLIAHINVGVDNAAHTLTCYGFTLDENNNINSLLIADSDDQWLYTYGPDNTGENGAFTPKLEQAFIKVDNGRMYLYEDAAFNTPTVDSSYSIGSVTYINTPEVLKNMLAEYSDVSNEAQVWNGESSVWGIQESTTEELPTAATGWDIHVNGENIATDHHGYYHTYSTDGRSVVFGNHAQNRIVSIEGTVSAAHIDIAASGYSFIKGTADASIQAGADMTVRSGASLDSALKLQLDKLTLEAGSTLKALEPIVVTGDFVVSAADSAAYTTRATATPEANVQSALDLRVTDSITMQAVVNMNGNDLYLSDGAKFYISQEDAGKSEILAFTDIGNLYLGDSMTESYILNADICYIGSETPLEYLLVYNQQLRTLSFISTIPEPTTTTLSMLALAALCSRRRRK